MKTCITMLCCLLLSALTQAQSEKDDSKLHVYFTFDEDEDNLVGEEEDRLLGVVYDLMLSQSVKIELRSIGTSYAAGETMAKRRSYFEEMCKEYQLDERTTSIDIVNRRFEDEPRADVHIAYVDPVQQPKRVRPESTFTHNQGWRARCYSDDVSFVSNTTVKVMHTPEEFQSINLLTEDEAGNRLEVVAIVSISLLRDTSFLTPLSFQIPLHGITESGCKEYLLMRNEQCTFPSEPGKATVKRADGLMLWKINVDRSGTFVIARPAKDVEAITFTAPTGYAITRAIATSSSPYMQINADIALNQLTATFSQIPAPENVLCEFVITDMEGNEYTTTGITAKVLMTDPLLSFLRRNENTLPDPALANAKK
ncbi:MAG: hypothetical protein ACKOZM_08385 [Flavobacteriales bacterium]